MAMLLDSRTKHDIFEEWRATNPSTTFTQFWHDKWRTRIDLYHDLGWKIIPLAIRGKRPFAGYHWSNRELNPDRAFEYACKDVNLAVVLNASGLMIVDWDERKIPQELARFFNLTMTAITPTGWHIYFKSSKVESDVLNRMRDKVNGKADMFRGGKSTQYTVLPLSVVRQYDPDKNLDGGYPRCYEWVNMKALVSFEIIVKELG